MTKKPPYTESEAAATHNHGATRPPLDPPDKSKAKANGNGSSKNGSKPPPSAKKRYAQNDSGNAERLLDAHGVDLRYLIDANHWVVWDGVIWKEDPFNVLVEAKAAAVASAMWAELGMAGIPRTQLSDMAKWALACGNVLARTLQPFSHGATRAFRYRCPSLTRTTGWFHASTALPMTCKLGFSAHRGETTT